MEMKSAERDQDWTEAYGAASQAFLLQDFGQAEAQVGLLLARAEKLTESDSRSHPEAAEVTRKAWILKITLLASSGGSSSNSAIAGQPGQTDLEKQLVQAYEGIKGYYGVADGALLHPSLLVAVSLAGLKLGLPGFSRRALEDYFDVLLCSQVEDIGLDESSAVLDASQADLSISGIADPARPQSVSWTKSLHRLARIYAVHTLGKTFQEWAEARNWIEQQRIEDIGIQVVTEDNAQSLLDELEAAKTQQVEEAIQAQRREQDRRAQASAKAVAEQRAKASSRSSERRTSPNGSTASTSGTSGSRSKPSRNSTAPTSVRTSRSASNEVLGWHRPSPPSNQDTGFAALRSRLSSLISSGRRTPTGVLQSSDSRSSLDIVKAYISRLASSRLASSILIFFLILGFVRRRMARQGNRLSLTDGVRKVKDKVLETVRMGASLGNL